MKKPVILVIGLIYILAIAVVGFLGIPARIYNPETFVKDINLVFDDKLDKLEPSETAEFRYKIKAEAEATFNITAKVVPNEATHKDVVFEKRDDYDETFYTYTTEYNEKNGYTIATYNVNPLPSGTKFRIISIKVNPTDGNKLLYKTIDIIVYNF